MTYMLKRFCALAFSIWLSACGGGGGGGGPDPGPHSWLTSNANLLSFNASPTTQNVVDYPIENNFDYSSIQVKFGHLGSTTANCFIVQTDTRGDRVLNPPNGSSPAIADAPFYAICQQVDGTFKEVSTQLFGQKYNINGAYPLIADFNGDGIDDIFLAQTWDGPFRLDQSHLYSFISKEDGTYNVTQLTNPGIVQTGMTALDINQDGCMDVVSTGAVVLAGDCHGGFLSTTIHGIPNQLPLYGTAICQGDFNNTGHPQLLITDASISGYANQNNIIEVGSDLVVQSVHALPTPFFTNRDSAASGSHNFQCAVGDINNDGKPDIMIFTSNYYETTQGAAPQFYVQTYLNQGGWSFQDTGATELPGNSNLNLGDSYSPRLIDLNGDGYLDLAFDSPTWTAPNNNLGNQVFINNKDGTFHAVFTTELKALADAYRTQLGATAGQPYLTMLPIINHGQWDFIMGAKDANGHLHLGVANTQVVFK